MTESSATSSRLPQTDGPISDAFSRRLPPSPPMPSETPKRPRPPALDVPDQPDSHSSFLPSDESTPAINRVGRRSKQAQAIRKKRRLALQEVRNASPTYNDEESPVIAAEQNSYSVKEKAIML
jgi:hypothetical protein